MSPLVHYIIIPSTKHDNYHYSKHITIKLVWMAEGRIFTSFTSFSEVYDIFEEN
jgi:hypothetical protein